MKYNSLFIRKNMRFYENNLIKAKLKALPQTVILDKWIPTTKLCPKCGRKHNVNLNERTYVCECEYHEDRDIHSA